MTSYPLPPWRPPLQQSMAPQCPACGPCPSLYPILMIIMKLLLQTLPQELSVSPTHVQLVRILTEFSTPTPTIVRLPSTRLPLHR